VSYQASVMSYGDGVMSYGISVMPSSFHIMSYAESFMSYRATVMSSGDCIMSNQTKVISDRDQVISCLIQILNRHAAFVHKSELKTTQQPCLTSSNSGLRAILLTYLNYARELKFSGKIDVDPLIAPSVWARDG